MSTHLDEHYMNYYFCANEQIYSVGWDVWEIAIQYKINETEKISLCNLMLFLKLNRDIEIQVLSSVAWSSFSMHTSLLPISNWKFCYLHYYWEFHVNMKKERMNTGLIQYLWKVPSFSFSWSFISRSVMKVKCFLKLHYNLDFRKLILEINKSDLKSHGKRGPC